MAVLAIDIGGSKIRAGVVDVAGRVTGRAGCALTGPLTAAGVLGAAVALGRESLREGGAVEAVGVTIPGLADPAAGVWVYAPFSGIRDVPVADELGAVFGVPVAVENDVNACALAEMRFGACTGVADFVWVTISNGIGGAVVTGGRLLTGVDNAAGEIGHLIVAEDGPRCGCGHVGCAEANAAGPAIARRYRAAVRGSAQAAGSDGPVVEPGGAAEADAAAIAALARGGDPVARRVYEDTGDLLGRALASVVSLLNPQAVILGGGVSQSFDLFGPRLRATLEARAFAAALPGLRVEPTTLGVVAGLLGAACVGLAGTPGRPDVRT